MTLQRVEIFSFYKFNTTGTWYWLNYSFEFLYQVCRDFHFSVINLISSLASIYMYQYLISLYHSTYVYSSNTAVSR